MSARYIILSFPRKPIDGPLCADCNRASKPERRDDKDDAGNPGGRGEPTGRGHRCVRHPRAGWFGLGVSQETGHFAAPRGASHPGLRRKNSEPPCYGLHGGSRQGRGRPRGRPVLFVFYFPGIKLPPGRLPTRRPECMRNIARRAPFRSKSGSQSRCAIRRPASWAIIRLAMPRGSATSGS